MGRSYFLVCPGPGAACRVHGLGCRTVLGSACPSVRLMRWLTNTRRSLVEAVPTHGPSHLFRSGLKRSLSENSAGRVTLVPARASFDGSGGKDFRSEPSTAMVRHVELRRLG